MMISAAAIEQELAPLLVAVHGRIPASFSGISGDSRHLAPGVLFIAVDGVAHDGRDHLTEAASCGAAAVVMKWRDRASEWPAGTPGWEVTDARRAYALLMRLAAGKPDEKLTLFGVTGTNGKTTTAFLLDRMLNACGIPCGLLSTIENRFGQRREISSGTTPEAAALAAAFAEMHRSGLSAAAMELSSHSLDQGRAFGVRFRAAIFTNLTGDHLDYHRTMENYYQAKKRFFTELLSPQGVAVIHLDDPWGDRLAGELPGSVRTLTFGTAPEADWRLLDLDCRGSGSSFTLRERKSGERRSFSIPLIGEHNVRNMTGVLLALHDFGLAWVDLARLAAQPCQVPGRLEQIRTSRGVICYVDYAHTDDALTNVLTILRQITPPEKTLHVVFGAGGDRDRTKRPRMGAAAAALADRITLTSDNPRSEDPDAIIDEIASGIPAGFPFDVEPDRRLAIEGAVRGAAPGDVILIAGKGHEDYQEIDGIRHPFSDRGIVEKM